MADFARRVGWLAVMTTAVLTLLLSACTPAPRAEAIMPALPVQAGEQAVVPTATAGVAVAAPASPTPLPTATAQPPTPIPTDLPTATSVATATAVAIPTVPPPGGTCATRMGDDLLTVVTQTYGLSRDYAPSDLVPLSDYLPQSVTLGYPTEIRAIAVEPLVTMITDMQTAGLDVWVMSGYRSYAAQSIAWNKWVEKYPDRAAILSARPGYSEHQLGTTVDFGTPELAQIVGPDFEFHTYFYQTQVGAWLQANAHRYGFTLSFPAETLDITGFYYEPWHWRYVGTDIATLLHEQGISLTEYALAQQPEPCVPE